MKITKFMVSMVIFVAIIIGLFAFLIQDGASKIKTNDVAIITYVGKVNGKAFKGGTSEKNTALVLGSNSFIDGFEDQVVGHKAGDKFKVNVTFPKTYQEKTLQNKKAVFDVNLKGFKQTKTKKYLGKVTKSDKKEIKNAEKKAQANSSNEQAIGGAA